MVMEPTLIEALNAQLKSNRLRFHMPGHKGKRMTWLPDWSIDFTELPGLDNLHFPKGCILRSESLAAELFGARETLFIVNGSSAGIIAAVLALSRKGNSVICARNSHVSVFKGLCLSGARPVYVMPEIIEGYGLCGGIPPEKIEEALESNKDAGAVFITSPTFEGFTSDVREIVRITRKYGVPLFVDEAHGAHFKFGGCFPETALEQGADIVVQSWHKTLAAYGQGAVLHIGTGNLDMDRLRFYLSAMQTTSPSYVIMASLDGNRELLQTKGAVLFEAYEDNLRHLREGLRKNRGFELISNGFVGSYGITGVDPGKITLFLRGGGKEIEAFLIERGVFIEMAARNHVVLMTSFVDSIKDYRELIMALSDFNGRCQHQNETLPELEYCLPEMRLTPKESLDASSASVPAAEARGRVSAGFITPYPPGIPLVAPGEVISGDIAMYCARAGGGVEINGLLEGGYLRVIV